MTVMSNEDPALPDDLTVIDACMTCLSDDAALLHSKNPEDEVADKPAATHSFGAVPNMRRSDYLAALMRQRPEWLLGSMAEPTRHMTRTHVLLHAVALRRMRAL